MLNAKSGGIRGGLGILRSRWKIGFGREWQGFIGGDGGRWRPRESESW